MGATSPYIIEIRDINRINKYSKKINKTPKKIKKLPKIKINKSEQLYNSICRIYDEKNKKNGTGFFMQIVIEDETFFFLITCDNIVTSEQIDNEETIVIYFLNNGKEEKRIIKIGSNRSHFIYFKPINITILEILDSDNISKDRFLYPDLNYKNGYNIYMNKEYFIAGFNKNKPFVSSCRIEDIIRFEFIHNINKGQDAFGSLICTKDNFNVIGIYKEGDDKDCNFGTFIGKIFDRLENSRKGIRNDNYVSMYKGTIQLGLRHGKGSGFYNDGGLYEGDWINDTREGNGIMYYSNGNIYIGEWKNDRREGIGSFYFCKGGFYKGEFKNNIIDGFGELKAGNGHNSWKFVGTLKIGALDNPNFDVVYFLSH